MAPILHAVKSRSHNRAPGQRNVSVSLPSAMLERLRAEAEAEERSVSWLIRKIVKDHYSGTGGSSVVGEPQPPYRPGDPPPMSGH